MLTLALDTSTSQGGIAIVEKTAQNHRVLHSNTWQREKSHSEFVTASVEECLKKSGVTIEDIELLAVGKGPGSFTGIRIAINVVKTLAFARQLSTMAFDTLEILAGGVPQQELPLLVLVNAHKNLLYTSIFESHQRSWKKTFEPSALSIEQIGRLITRPHLCVGDGFLELSEFFPAQLKSRLLREPKYSDFPSPEVLGKMALNQFSTAQSLDWNAVQALYIRASEAEEKLREGRS